MFGCAETLMWDAEAQVIAHVHAEEQNAHSKTQVIQVPGALWAAERGELFSWVQSGTDRHMNEWTDGLLIDWRRSTVCVLGKGERWAYQLLLYQLSVQQPGTQQTYPRDRILLLEVRWDSVLHKAA